MRCSNPLRPARAARLTIPMRGNEGGEGVLRVGDRARLTIPMRGNEGGSLDELYRPPAAGLQSP